MSKKHFSWLVVVTLAAAVLVLLVPGKTGKESTFESSTLLPGLAAVANELDYIRLVAGGDETIATFERTDGLWRLKEASSYPADWSRLKTLLSGLSGAEVIEEKTSNPELYARLGVEDISEPGATGIRIEFAESTELPALIVGNQATGREGQYVRLAGAQSSGLIGIKLDVPTDRMQWLNRKIIDIAADEVVEVTVTHPDGEIVNVRKKSADDKNFELQEMPPGREIKSEWTVNSLGGSLAALQLDELASDTGIDWSNPVVFSLLTADGMRASCWLADHQELLWIRCGVSVYQALKNETDPAQEASQELAEELTDRVNEINERVSGWAYQIPQSRFDSMTKRMEDLLQPTEAP